MSKHRLEDSRALRAGGWLALCVMLGGAPLPPCAAQAAAEAQAVAPDPPEAAAVHGQFTYTEQESNRFNAPYRGPNSLSPHAGRETTDATLYLGHRLWQDAELWINPEVDQGFGLDDTLGVAGFTSGEAYKVGRNQPYFRLQRVFVRDTFNSGEDRQPVAATANVLGGGQSRDRWVVTLGKMSVGDIFDLNQYAHDPRNDFLNWSVIDAGAFDYAADAWGYSAGAALEWYHGASTWRAAVYDLSDVPNSEHLTPGFHQFQWIAEAERRYALRGEPGKALLTVYVSRGRMAQLDDALALAEATGGPINLAAVRRYRSRTGVSANLEQSVTADIGVFARAGGAQGDVEAYEFTDIDRSVLAGVSLNGGRWRRAADTFAIAAVANRISSTRQRYLAAGGLGILVGDGRLPDPGSEQIVEAYYRLAVTQYGHITLDYQRVKNPAYNEDRGPASVFAIRVHGQF